MGSINILANGNMKESQRLRQIAKSATYYNRKLEGWVRCDECVFSKHHSGSGRTKYVICYNKEVLRETIAYRKAHPKYYSCPERLTFVIMGRGGAWRRCSHFKSKDPKADEARLYDAWWDTLSDKERKEEIDNALYGD